MEYIVTIVVFALLVAPLIFIPWLRSRERGRILRALIEASEKGQALPADLMQSLIGAVSGVSRIPPASRDVRRGVFWLGAALTIVAIALAVYGFCVAGGIQEGAPAAFCVAALGLIPAFIGGGYLVVARLGRQSNGGAAG